MLVFVALALAPSLLTLVVLWRELAPRTRLLTSQGIERSMQAAIVLARTSLAARHAAADSCAHRIARAVAAPAIADTPGPRPVAAILDSLVPPGGVALVYLPTARRIVATHGGWRPAGMRNFLDQPSVHWPEGPFPADLVAAPDSGYVVAGTGAVEGSAGASGEVRRVLVALPVPSEEAAAIRAVVQAAQQSRRLGFFEELKLATMARGVGVLSIVTVGLAVLLGALLARTVTRPIERLRQAFEAVAAGDHGHQVDVGPYRKGEVGRLLRRFNAMSRELEESKRQLVRAARLAAWQDVARRLAHEIKNPLTPITLSIHRLRRRTPEDDTVVRECLDTILEETSHLERLANEFSSFARMPKPELRPIDPAPVLQQVLDLYAAHPGVRIRADLQGIPGVLADRDQVRQVFTNLLKNAVEAMPGGGDVELRWERANGHLLVHVLDGGPGFAPAALEHLFDPTFTTKATGSGLGLAIVRRILEDHGGSIEVGNRPDRGAWVRIALRLDPTNS